MSPAAESDLYDDLYGEEEQQEEQLQDYDDEEPKAASSTLPAKPAEPSPAMAAADAAALSYSAQVARQFSEYQQTPSQERQPQFTHGLPQNPRPIQAVPSTSGTIRPSEMHEEGKMFVGGLNWDTTDDGLKEYFSQFGKVDACTIMRDPDGRSRGFAFMTFEDASSCAAVVAQSHHLDGKAIDPKRAIPREEHLRNTRYFVGGLAPATTGETMKAFFATWGKVVDATVMVDRESGRSKGFGFVTYEDATSADQLIGKPGLILDDKQIEVKAAQARSARDAARNTPGSTPTTTPFTSPSFPASFNGGNMTMGGVAPTPFISPNPGAAFFGNPMMGGGMGGGMNPMMMAMYQRMAAGGGMGGMGGAQGMGGMGGGMMNPAMMMNMMNMMGGGMMGNPGMGGMGQGMVGGMGGNPAMRMGMGPLAGTTPQTQVGGGAGLGVSVARPMNGGTRTGTPGAAANGNAQAGPVRTNRGGHGYHPYAR